MSEPDSEGSAGTDAFDQLVLRLELGEALAELTPAHREVLELQYAVDLTQAQVAERLRSPAQRSDGSIAGFDLRRLARGW